ncbi:unnamed protein product [Prunus brigantina]
MAESNTTKPTDTSSDPLSLHNSDTPGLSLVNFKLEGHNYGQWSRSMHLSLSAKNKLGFVDGSVKTPSSDDSKFPLWQRCNDMVLSWILHSLHPDIASSVLYAKTAAAVWTDLRDRFSQGNDSKIYQIRQEIVECRQGQQTISIYYTKLKALWDELASYQEPFSCACDGMKNLAERVMQFLMGLNDTYSTVRGSILMMNPLPDTRKVHGLVLQHERQVEVTSRNDSLITPHAMQISRSSVAGSSQPRKSLKCTYCDGDGHTKERCYFIIGFPVGHKWHGKNVKPRNQRYNPTAHNVELHQSPATHTDTAKTTTADGPTFTTEEYNELIAMLRNKKGNTQPLAHATGIITPTCNIAHHDPHSTLYWIVDSGATDHISHMPPTHNHTATHHEFVGLPNGEQAAICNTGSIKLSSDLSLDGVLHVPKFRVNLLSVSKLTRALRCIVIFSPDFCVVQDVDTKKTIGLGKHFDGLYYLMPTQNPHLASHVRRISTLWHQRLGHPSPAPLHHLSKIIPEIMFNSQHISDPAQLPSFPPLSGPSFPSPSSLSMPPLSPIVGGSGPPLPLLGPSSTSLDPPIPSTSLDPPMSSTSSDPPVHLTPTDPPHLPRRSERVKRLPPHFHDYKAHHTALLTPGAVSSSTSGTRYPLHWYISYSGLSPAYRNFVCNISRLVEPSSYAQACQDPKWVAAIHSELQALDTNHTWSLVPLPPGHRPIGCKWIFRIKYNSDGTIDHYKARLVAKGFNQREGIDFTDTFAPVAKLITVRCLLSVAAARDWPLHQMDVHNAFLHGDLQEEVYMLPPPGSRRQGEHVVCRLHKSLYGLKQALRSWFRKFSSAICGIGFKQSRADYSLFTHVQGSSLTIILLYVDDMIITGNDEKAICKLKHFLGSQFRIKDLGSLKYFLGVEVARSKTGISICQRKYTLDILEEAGLLGAKPAKVPMDPDLILSPTGELLKDPSRYHRLVGKLIYLTITRPEITYAVNTLSQFMQEPKRQHLDAAYRLLHYLKEAPGQGLLFSAENKLKLIGYCDADWARCPITRRSVTGYCIFLGNALVSWKSKKQDLRVAHSKPAKLFCDNQAALYIAANPVYHERTKHIELDCHTVRERIERGEIKTGYVHTGKQIADLFTKPLRAPAFSSLLGKLGVINIHIPT